MSTAALFVAAKSQDQCKCPSLRDQSNHNASVLRDTMPPKRRMRYGKIQCVEREKKEAVEKYLWCNVICFKQKRAHMHAHTHKHKSLYAQDISGRLCNNLKIGSEI